MIGRYLYSCRVEVGWHDPVTLTTIAHQVYQIRRLNKAVEVDIPGRAVEVDWYGRNSKRYV